MPIICWLFAASWLDAKTFTMREKNLNHLTTNNANRNRTYLVSQDDSHNKTYARVTQHAILGLEALSVSRLQAVEL